MTSSVARTVTSVEGPHVVQRILPILPVQAMETFAIASPVDTHFKVVRCDGPELKEGCVRNKVGWRTVLDVSTVEGARQAKWIINFSGRSFTRQDQGSVLTFTFAAGQQCFQKHRVPLGRPELYIVRDGDWRGNPTGHVYRHTRPEHWVEHSAESFDRLDRTKKRG